MSGDLELIAAQSETRSSAGEMAWGILSIVSAFAAPFGGVATGDVTWRGALVLGAISGLSAATAWVSRSPLFARKVRAKKHARASLEIPKP